VLRPARPVVELGPEIAAPGDWGGCVAGVHDRLDEKQLVIRRRERILKVAAGPDHERPRRGAGVKHFRQIGIGPVGDVVVRFGLADVAAFDGVSAVVDQQDRGLVIVPQNGRQFLRRDLEGPIAHSST